MIETERLDASSGLPWVRREHDARFTFVAGCVAGRRVVDCACGTGRGLEHLIAAGARQVIGVERSPAACRIARQAAPLAAVVLADGRAIPLRDGAAEVFVCLETIEHIEDDQGFLDEVARVLADTGTFICSTPNRTVSNPGLARAGRPANPFHVREYSQEEFLALLGVRFGSVEVYGQNPSPSWWVRALGGLGRIMPLRLVTRGRQLLKLRYLLPPLQRLHDVAPISPGRECEYLVAVCSLPRGRR